MTQNFNAWQSVSCLLFCFFYFPPFLGMRIALYLSLSFFLSTFATFISPSVSRCLSVPSILWCSVSQPTTYDEIFFRRMVTKCNCFIWMMHFGIYTFSTVIYWFFFFPCVACVNLFSLFFFHLYVSLFLNTDWLCLFTSHLHPSPLTFPSHLCLLCVWRGSALDCFDWSLFCIRSLLIG